MMILLPLLSPALVYFVVLVVLAVKKNTKGIATSLVFFVVAVTVGYWSIIQSRSSTAALGFLWLPFLGSIVGFLGLVFGRWAGESREREPRRILGWAALVASLVLVGYTAAEGVKTRSRASWRDRDRATFNAELYRNRELIARAVASNPARERAFLDSSIRANIDDRAFLLAALHSDSISPDVLDTLAKSRDRGIALEAIRNPATRGETLTSVYETNEPPDYFFQALAGHANTPPAILRKIYANPGVISGLEIWFAGNPATPKDVLAKISAGTSDEHVLDRLIQNPALDCSMLRQVAAGLKRVNRPADDYSGGRVAERVRMEC